MRTATLALLAGFTLGAAAPVHAADLDYGVLRGPDYEPEIVDINWNGVYVGGHGGYTSASAKSGNRYGSIIDNYFSTVGPVENSAFSNAVRSATPDLVNVRNSENNVSYGAFAGFNYQFDETVVGFEADYTRFDRANVSESTVSRAFVDPITGNPVGIDVMGRSSTKIIEYGTIRARGGYAIGNFLPFITGGIAVGRAAISEQVVVNDKSGVNAPYDRQISATSFGKNPMRTALGNLGKTKTVAGFALGAGLDFAVTQNIILRGEYQYVMFDDFDGHKAHVNTFRGGAAIKF